MIILVVNIVGIILLWVFSYVGIRQYEYAQQDGDTKYMKLFVHLLVIALITLNIYDFVSRERGSIASNATMVEEVKK